MIPLLCSIIFGITGIWLMLPPSGPRRRRVGAILAAVALGLLGYLLPPLGDKVQQGIFWVIAGLTSVGALATISSRNPVYCAIWFALTLLTTAGLFLLQGAQFLGVATVVVYAGAILVTFLFVLMLAQPAGHDFYDRISWGPAVTFFAAIAGVLIVGGLTYILTHDNSTTAVVGGSPLVVGGHPDPLVGGGSVVGGSPDPLTKGLVVVGGSPDPLTKGQQPAEDLTSAKLRQQNEHHMASIGGELFTKHLVSVEVAGTLLLVALVGAIAIVIQGKQKQSRDDETGTGGPSDVG